MNESGIHPVEYKVLVRPEAVEEKTKGGIYIPDVTKDKEQDAQIIATVIEVSEMAFSDPDWIVKPQSGDKVYIAKYAGYLVKGKDHVNYRVINDKEIVAIIEE